MTGDDFGDQGEGYLEEEKKNDPLARANKFFDAAEKLLKRGEQVGEPVYPTMGYITPAAPKQIALNFRKISNGFVLTKVLEHGQIDDETFCATLEELVAMANTQIRSFVASQDSSRGVPMAPRPPSSAPDGT